MVEGGTTFVMIAALLAVAVQGAPSDLQDLLGQVDPVRLRATVEKLASFHTRNTLSPTLTEAAEWLAEEYRKIPGIQVELMRYTIPAGRRVPEAKEVVQVVAKLPGESDRIVLVGGHLDSLNLQVDAETGRAPGANDDASGTALALELARVMAGRKWQQTLMFVGFTGEEQGLHGARALAKRAKSEGWKIDAVLNNDTVGSSENKAGQKDDRRVRVFSDESESHNSRELARLIEYLVRTNMKDFEIRLVFRRDRFGRGGDHTPFNEEGFDAVRFIEVHEEYSRQHTHEDLPEYMDWSYLANVTKANLVAMYSLGLAGEPPTNVRIDMRQGHDTTITWQGKEGQSWVVYWRETTSPVWQGAFVVESATRFTLQQINKDDHVFAVGALGGIPVNAR
ncbi:MAG: M20/M25/M40 family metallo-hydrolase [Fimbriimonadales bacterium]|nr:M20/M25/M40 family metallo-hydrolase [Fimbriimonadales bacterium]